jgi:hypothetical protein
MAHGGVEATVARHLPYWQKYVDDVMFFCPNDKILHLPESREVVAVIPEPASHHDATANRRFKRVLQMLLCTAKNYDRFILHEYDSLHLGPPIFAEGYLGANAYDCPYPTGGFLAHIFTHPPLTMETDVLIRLSAAVDLLPDDCENGFWDRMVGLACERNGIPIYDFMSHRQGFSKNTIEPGDIFEASAAILFGAVCIHGVKDANTLSRILT